jgi:hypothetical protein
MVTAKGSVDRARPKRPRARTRWSFVLVPLVLSLALVVSRTSAQEDEQSCSDFNVDGRQCTYTEELAFCVKNAITSYDECKEDEGLIGKVKCTLLYEADFYACTVSGSATFFLGKLLK